MSKLLAFFIFFLLFIGRLYFLPRLDLKDGQLVRVTGTLMEEPQVSSNRQKVKLGQFEIWTERYPEYHYGDKIEATGKIKTQYAKRPPANDLQCRAGNTQHDNLFSFISPLISSTTYLLDKAEIRSVTSITGTTSTTGIKGRAIELRRRLKSNYIQYYSSPLDGLVAGIVLGDKSLIPLDFWQKLKQTGTLHVMVASGMNIAMFSNGILSFFTLFFKRRLAILFVILTIWFYCLIAGMQPPILRAGIMASLMYLSQLIGREAERGRVLFITAGLMLFANPFLLWDVGFQLSFLATAGIVFVSPKIKGTTGIKSTTSITHSASSGQASITGRILRNENFSSSVAAQIATLPILIGSFGQINLLSPLINLSLLWTIPTILQMGMAIGLLGIVWTKLGETASYLIFPLLFYLKQSINLFAKLTFFQIELPEFGWCFGIVYYAILIYFIKRKAESVKRKTIA